jgi:Holliday junction DNA helicase RuvB
MATRSSTISSIHIDEEEKKLDSTLRPKTLSEFIGQTQLKNNLKIYIEAAKKREEPLEHCLFSGPPGLGKTTLAHIIANEMNTRIVTIVGPTLERVGDLAAILSNLNEGDVFFIDEIHRLNRLVEEALYPAMEEFILPIVTGTGPGARTIKLPLPRFTLIGATTRIGLLLSPLRNRFGILGQLDYYTPEDLAEIVKRSAKILNIKIEENATRIIGARARGTPRIANRLLRRIRDFAEVKYNGVITEDIATEALSALEIDELGLDVMDRKILSTIIEKFNGGPVGIETLAISISEEKDTIIEVYEPYLVQIGFMKHTPRGRVVTDLAYRHLKIPKRDTSESTLF